MMSDAFYVPLLVAYFVIVLSNPTLPDDGVHTNIIPNHEHEGGAALGCYEDVYGKEAHCRWRGLDAVPQYLSEDLQLLDLLLNQIKSLLNSSFQRYPRITYLDLSSNAIRVIESGSFYPLKELSTLRIVDNRHPVLADAGLFRWNGKLAILDLSVSNLKSLPNDTLSWSSQWESINLSWNKLTAINCDNSVGRLGSVNLAFNEIRYVVPDNFTFTCPTDILSLQFNRIAHVDPNAIAMLNVESLLLEDSSLAVGVHLLKNVLLGISRSTIKQLHVIYSGLTDLPNDTFVSLSNHTFSALNFMGNQLNLYPQIFSNLAGVGELNLGYNKISAIEPVFFDGMQQLRILKLDQNKIGHINRHGHSWSVDLYELYLSDNLLVEITPKIFYGLRNLSNLYLSYNKQLVFIEINSFRSLENLQTLDLSGCNIDTLRLYIPRLSSLYIEDNLWTSPFTYRGDDLKHTPSLLKLSLANSHVVQYQLWNIFQNVSVFAEMINLTYLDLSENDFVEPLEPGIFQGLSSLQELRLCKCSISYFHPSIFHGLRSLKVLNIAGNEIKHLNPDVLQALTALTILQSSNNSIDRLNNSMFSNNSKLESLDLSNNKLTHLNENTFRPIKFSIFSLDISDNPIECNCDLKWFPKWLIEKEDRELKHKDETICSLSSLAHFRDKRLIDFEPGALCQPNIILLCLVPLSIFCLIVMLVLMYNNRWLLKHKLFLLKLAVVGYKELQDNRDQNDYEFDVNIIFYDDDDEWVQEHLRPALEEHLPQFQRNIFGDEDLVLGMHYLDSVDYVVTHSYKTVIVLSRACVQDRWFMLKLRIAMDHVSDTRTEFVLVVFLEDIPDNEIPFLARLYLSDGRPYLYWPEDPRGQEYFWDKLARSLTVNLRTDDLIPKE